MASSNLLFDPAKLPAAIRYEKLFENLPEVEKPVMKTGRRPVSRNALLKALVYKALRRIDTLSELSFELNNNPTMAQTLGFNPLKSAPSVERFSSFLHDTENEKLQAVREKLVQLLIDHDGISAAHIAIDSCPIVVSLKENNLKTSLFDRFNKTREPAGDPDAKLGAMVHFIAASQKVIRYFWGYRNHVISDVNTELPIWERTRPANVSEIKIAKPLMTQLRQRFDLNIQIVCADAQYDAEDFLKFIILELNAKAVIPRQARGQKFEKYQIKNGKIICEAGLEMYCRGKMRPKPANILYRQYSCPIVYDKKIKYQYLMCPVFHPKFIKGKGCNVLISD